MFIIKACFDYGILRYRAKKKKKITLERSRHCEPWPPCWTRTLWEQFDGNCHGEETASLICLSLQRLHEMDCEGAGWGSLATMYGTKVQLSLELFVFSSVYSVIRVRRKHFVSYKDPCWEFLQRADSQHCEQTEHRRLRSNTLYPKPEISLGYKTPTVIFKWWEIH